VLSGNDGLKGNFEGVTPFFGRMAGCPYWLHRDDAFGLVVIDHRLADGVGGFFNLVNIAVVLP
jgi:hypothetical protein